MMNENPYSSNMIRKFFRERKCASNKTSNKVTNKYDTNTLSHGAIKTLNTICKTSFQQIYDVC